MLGWDYIVGINYDMMLTETQIDINSRLVCFVYLNIGSVYYFCFCTANPFAGILVNSKYWHKCLENMSQWVIHIDKAGASVTNAKSLLAKSF